MKIKSAHAISRISIALTGILLAGAVNASPFEQVLNGFQIGMTKAQMLERIAQAGGNPSNVNCVSPYDPAQELCLVSKEFKPSPFYGHKVEDINVSLENGKVSDVSIKLDWGALRERTIKSRQSHERVSTRALNKLRNEMKPLEPEERAGRMWIWKKDSVSLSYWARHWEDMQFPAPHGSFISISVYDNTPKPNEIEEKEAGWLSKLRSVFKS